MNKYLKRSKKIISLCLLTAIFSGLGHNETIFKPTKVFALDNIYEVSEERPEYIFDKSKGDFKLEVPPNAFESDSVTMVWTKPSNYQEVTQYKILQSTDNINYVELPENAWDNYIGNFAAGPYVENFYKNSGDGAFSIANHDPSFYIKIQPHCYKVKGLEPNTEYYFKVVSYIGDSIDKTSDKVNVKTRVAPKQLNVEDYGASSEATWQVNTAAIQKAIDDSKPLDEVLIPSGSKYTIGSIFLKDNMTLRLDGELIAADDFNAYPRVLMMKPYASDLRSYALINIINYDYEHPFKNVRIVGKGSFDGQGVTTLSTNPDEIGKDSPVYAATSGSAPDVSKGIVSKTIVEKAIEDGIKETFSTSTAYNTRPSWLLARGVDGVYVEGITAYNPSYHGYIFSECKNVVVNNLTIQSFDGNNGDGLEFDNTNYIWAFGIYSNSGDDAFNLAAGQGTEALKYNYTGDLWMFNNYVGRGHGGVTCGSYLGSGIRNIFAEDDIFYMTQSPFRNKANTSAGGDISDVLYRDIAVKDPGEGGGNFTFQIDTSYADSNSSVSFAPRSQMPMYQRITVQNVTADSKNNVKAKPLKISDNKEKSDKYFGSIKDIKFENVTFKNYTDTTFDLYNAMDVSFNNLSVKNSNGNEIVPKWSIINCLNLDFSNYDYTEIPTVKKALGSLDFGDDAKFEAKSTSSSSITLKWDLPQSTNEATILGTKVFVDGKLVLENAKTTSTSAIATVTVAGDKNEYEVKGLEAGTEYVISIISISEGSQSNELKSTFKTDGEKEIAKIPVTSNELTPQLVSTGFTHATVTWPLAKIDDTNNYPTFYKFNIYANDELVGETNQAPKGSNAFSIVDLEPNTEYSIYVKLVGLNGIESKASEAISVNTKRMFDKAVPEFHLGNEPTVKVNEDNIEVSWNGASDDIGVFGYRVYVDGKLFSATKGGAQNEADIDWLPTTISSQSTILSSDELKCIIPFEFLQEDLETHTVSISASDKLDLDYLIPEAFYNSGGRPNATTYVSTWSNPAYYSKTFTTKPAETFTVNFETNGGSQVASITNILEGGKIVKPNNPIKSGYNFVGWYKDADTKTLFDFDKDTISSNITIYAKWSKQSESNNNNNSSSSSSSSSQSDKKETTVETKNTVITAKSSNTDTQLATDVARKFGASVVSDTINVSNITKSEKITFKVTNDTTLKATTYVCLQKDGTLMPVPTYINKTTKEAYVLASSEGTYFGITLNKNFADVKPTDWFYKSVLEAANKLIVQGDDDKFRPTDNVTNAEVVTMFLRSVGIPFEKANKDVSLDTSQTNWYENAMSVAVKNNIIPSSNVNASANISRINTSKIIVATLKALGIDTEISDSEISTHIEEFKDVSNLSSSQKKELAICIKYGILVGNDDNTMTPTGILNRAQMAIVSTRLSDLIVKIKLENK